MDTESELGLDANSVLDRDTVPNENQSTSCFSCDVPVVGLYCAECGQKNDNYRRSISSLGIELFSSLTAIEGRIWRSLRSLILQPGRMSREFADGARQKWTSPVRMYLAIALVLFGYVSLSKTQLIAFGTKANASQVLQVDPGIEKFTPAIYFFKRKGELVALVSDEAISALESEFNDAVKADNKKSISTLEEEIASNNEAIARMQTQINSMSNPFGKAGIQSGVDAVKERNEKLQDLIKEKRESKTETPDTPTKPISPQIEIDDSPTLPQIETSEPPVSTDDEDEKSDGSSFSISGPDGTKYNLSGEQFLQAGIAALKQPERINGPIGKWLPRIMFLMMPFSMLMGAIFIRGKSTAMLYDHLVHAAYIHAFSFLLLFVFILLVQFTTIPYLLGVYMLILLIYLPISAKRMFKRGWFKSILTSYSVGLVYTFIMTLILAGLLITGILDIAREFAIAQT